MLGDHAAASELAQREGDGETRIPAPHLRSDTVIRFSEHRESVWVALVGYGPSTRLKAMPADSPAWGRA